MFHILSKTKQCFVIALGIAALTSCVTTQTKVPEPAFTIVYDDRTIQFDPSFNEKIADIVGPVLNSTKRFQINAYANTNVYGQKRARRVALSRALRVRSHLIRENGINSLRIDVRATDRSGINRTDLFIIEPNAEPIPTQKR